VGAGNSACWLIQICCVLYYPGYILTNTQPETYTHAHTSSNSGLARAEQVRDLVDPRVSLYSVCLPGGEGLNSLPLRPMECLFGLEVELDWCTFSCIRNHTPLCLADGSTHTESRKLYRKVKHRARPNTSSRWRPKRAPTRRRSRRRQRRGEFVCMPCPFLGVVLYVVCVYVLS